MESTVQIRSRTASALAVGIVTVAVVGLVSTVIDGGDALLDYGAPLLLIGLMGWAAFWRPCVEVSDGGVRVVNTLRTVQVPWPAIEAVEGRYGLRLQTAYGGVTAWGAGAPAGRQRTRGVDSEAATVINERLAALRAAGHLDDRRLERPDLRVTWHRKLIAAVAVLLVASVVLPLIG